MFKKARESKKDVDRSQMAAALGLKGGARELREATLLRLRQHFRQGGLSEGRDDATRATHALEVSWPGGMSWAAAALRSYCAVRRLALEWAEYAGASLTALLRLGPGLWLSEESSHSELKAALPRGQRVDLDRALRRLVKVHGTQLLLDGVYNADPHQGNVM